MTLLIVLAAYCVTRALENASTRWLSLAGAVVGFSFLAKGLQPFTVLPALAIAYLVAAPTSLRRRLLQLLGAGIALIVGAGWWILAVDLTPAADRPYIGGSGNNTALGLAFGYNGVSRITGGSGSGGGGANFSGTSGIGRLFNSLNGGQIAWLLPAALIAIVALVVVSGRAARTDRVRAAVILWGGWLIVTGAVLSFASGIIHTYYSVELAPAIAALVGQTEGSIGYVELSYAISAKLPYAYIKNRSGAYIPPCTATLAAAALKTSFPSDLRTSLTWKPAPNAYPITATTFALVYQNQTDAAKAKALVNFLSWVLTTGQNFPASINYAPEGKILQQKALSQLNKITVGGKALVKIPISFK